MEQFSLISSVQDNTYTFTAQDVASYVVYVQHNISSLLMCKADFPKIMIDIVVLSLDATLLSLLTGFIVALVTNDCGFEFYISIV